MEKDITFASVSRSLNRLEGFVDDFLLTVQSYNEKRNIEKQNVIVDGHKETMVIYPIDIKESIIRYVKDVEQNINGDECIDYIGIHDCVDFILYSQSKLLAKRAFTIESKVREIESILLSYCSGNLIKPVSDLTGQTGHILWEIGELHIEPFVQEMNQDAVIPETGKNTNESIDDNSEADDKPVTKENEDDSIDNVFAKLENRYVLAYKKAFSLDEYKYRGFYEKCKNKTPLEIAELFYNDAEVPDGNIKAVYYVCVVPNMTEKNQCVYETFLNYYNACDGR